LKTGAVFDPGVISVKANLRPEDGAATGIVALFDTKSGQVAAILDSADITAMRTADRRQAKEKASFCEQKEAKNSTGLGHGLVADTTHGPV
jgi:ornithine cyclodeaminase/alanine dehydrogenase-like protein (mu-crystallin family)